MRLCSFPAALAVYLALSLGTTNAAASPLTFQFGVTATDGPLIGATSSGTLTFDSSIIPPAGGLVSIAGLFTHLAFAWDGVNYNETTANTGELAFATDGTLYAVLFGTNCGPSGFGCGVGNDRSLYPRQWDFSFFVDAGAFQYITPTDPLGGPFNGSVTFTGPVSAVSAPGTLSLLCGGLTLLAFCRRSHSPIPIARASTKLRILNWQETKRRA
jgi:hypothetical protein